jgi:hypothetical protein
MILRLPERPLHFFRTLALSTALILLPGSGLAQSRFYPGDVDGDGRISALDAALTLQYGVGLRAPLSLESERAADLSQNGRIDALDASLILQTAVGVLPRLTISARRLTDRLPATYELTATVSGAVPPYNYAWDVNNDGQTDFATQTGQATFQQEGTSSVSLRVTDSRNKTSVTKYDLNVDVTPPAPIQGLRADTKSGSCWLSWEEGGAERLQGFNVYRRRNGEASFTKINGHIARNRWLDEYLENDVSYSYCVTAVDLAGNESQPLATVTATPGDAPPLPSVVSVVASGPQSLDLTWKPTVRAVG